MVLVLQKLTILSEQPSNKRHDYRENLYEFRDNNLQFHYITIMETLIAKNLIHIRITLILIINE